MGFFIRKIYYQNLGSTFTQKSLVRRLSDNFSKFNKHPSLESSGDIELYVNKGAGTLFLYFNLEDSSTSSVPTIQEYILRQEFPDSAQEQILKLGSDVLQKYLNSSEKRKLIMGKIFKKGSKNLYQYHF